MVLLAILRLGGDAYGVTICQELQRRTQRDFTLGAVYKTLGRLERKGHVACRITEPTPDRGGRRKKIYRLRPEGEMALSRSFAAIRGLVEGLGKELEAL